jgi:hypothetical protein
LLNQARYKRLGLLFVAANTRPRAKPTAAAITSRGFVVREASAAGISVTSSLGVSCSGIVSALPVFGRGKAPPACAESGAVAVGTGKYTGEVDPTVAAILMGTSPVCTTCCGLTGPRALVRPVSFAAG